MDTDLSKHEAGNWKGGQETDDMGQARQSRKGKGKARCGREGSGWRENWGPGRVTGTTANENRDA